MVYIDSIDIRMGNPSKYTPERRKIIIDGLRKGNFVTTVCRVAGISRELFYQWINAGARGEPDFVEFANQVEEARGLAIADMVDILQGLTTNKNPFVQLQSVTWQLARIDRKHYGQSVKVETEEQKKLEQMNDEEIDQFMHEKGWVRAGSSGNSDRE